MPEVVPALPAALHRVGDLPTPALVIDRAALERNLGRMQSACDAAGVRLRSHGKMHKCSTLGRLQVARGAVGLCCQTVGEAAAFAAAGIADLLVTSPVPPWGAAPLAALAREGRRIGAVVDSAAQVERLGAAARAAGVILDVLVDLDLGQHRTGVAPRDALPLARLAASTEGLRWRGVQAYVGHLQHLDGAERREAADRAVLARLAAVVAELSAAGLAPEVVTGGGTGTYRADLAGGVFTELQAGSYAVMDAEYDACGGPESGGGWAFEPAVAVASTVVSANRKTHVTVDAGLKALSVDGPPARVLAGAAPGSLWRPMGDEHGAIFHPSALELLRAAGRDPLAFAEAVDRAESDAVAPWPTDAPREGARVWLQPGHCDPTFNLYDAVWVADETGGLERWPIDARRVSGGA